MICVLVFSKSPSLQETTTTSELSTYTLNMAHFDKDLNRGLRHACVVLSVNCCTKLVNALLKSPDSASQDSRAPDADPFSDMVCWS